MPLCEAAGWVYLCTEAEAQRSAELRQLEEWRIDPAAAVAARKAAAPAEVRTVLDGGLDAADVYASDEHRRLARVVALWLVDAHVAAHADPATKRLARLVLGVLRFTANMSWAGVWELYKEGLRRALRELGAPLAAAFAAQGLRAKLGALTLPPHALVAADQARCAAAGRKHELRSDIAGVVPLPPVWTTLGDDAHPAARQHHERVFTHMLAMTALALNGQFHAMLRGVLAPHVVAGVGVMAQNEDDDGRSWRLTPVKGVARMECKRVTDHGGAPGCRPTLNIDVMRVLGVCETPEQLQSALAALGDAFGGCGRVKNGFGTEDAKAADSFDLRVVLGNFVVDFCCTFAELAAQPGVAGMWAAHVETSAPEGGAPRGRWRAEAAEARAVLAGAAFADTPVRFICEAQMMLRETHDVRAHMHELYKGYRADSNALLHADMLGETTKVARARQFADDGDTALKMACRDGAVAVAVRLLEEGAPAAERDAAFIVTCARGRGKLLAALPALHASAARTWAAAWERAADNEWAAEVGADVVAALLAGAAGLAGGVDFRGADDDAEGRTALLRAAKGGHTLAVDRLLGAGAVVDLALKSDGATPLIMAAQNGHEAVVARLLAAGAVVDLARKSDGCTPLFFAASKGHEAVVARLLNAGAAPELARKSDGFTPLIVAAQNGHEAVVARLLAAGAPPDLAGSEGATPLIMAAMQGHEVVVARLLTAGATSDLADHDGGTPQAMAAFHGHGAVVALLA